MSSLLAGESTESTQAGDQNSTGDNGGEKKEGLPQGQPDWKSQLIPEDIRGEKTWEKYQDPSAALKSLYHLEKKMGNAVNIPGEKATPEELAEFYGKLGVPKESKEYKYTEPKLPEGASWDKAQLGEFVDVAHKLHLTPAQLQGVLDYYGQKIGSQLVNPEEEYAKNKEALSKEWGKDADANFAAAREAAKLLGKEAIDALREVGLDNDPRIVKAMARLGAEMGEDRHVSGEATGGLTMEQAQKKVTEIMATADHPLHNKKHAGHAAAVAEYEELLKLAYPSMKEQ